MILFEVHILILFLLCYGMVARLVEDVEGFIESAAALGTTPCTGFLVRYTVYAYV